jgi:hypothetical protein
MTERSPMAEYPRLVVVRTRPYRHLAEAVAPVGTPLGQDGGPAQKAYEKAKKR